MESVQKSVANKGKAKSVHLRYLFYLFLSLLTGLLFARKLYSGDATYIICTIMILLGLTIILCLKKKIVFCLLILIIFFSGNGLFFLSYNIFMGKEYAGQCAVVGRVSDDMTSNATTSRIKLDNVHINGEKAKNIYLIVYGGQSLENGDILAFTGKVEHVNMFELGTFNLSYLRDRTPYTCTIKFEEIVIQEQSYIKYDETIRASVKKQLFANMSERNAGICYAVLFGDKSMVDDDIEDAYRATGIIHMLTVSGLHFGFLISLIYLALKPFKCNKYIKLSILFTILLAYNVLCGFAPSVLRASIMALVILLSKMFGREYDSLSSASLAGFIILLINPLTALDVGFLMSFFCVCGLFLLYRPLNKLLKKILPRPIASSIAVSIAAQLGVLCFFASMFQKLNILSFFANLVIIPIFGLAFPILFVLAFISPIIPFVGKLLIIADLLFVVINALTMFFATTNLTIPLYSFDLPVSIAIFFLMFICSNFFMLKTIYKGALVSFLTLFTVFAFIFVNLPKQNKNSVTFLESYDSTAQLISSSSGQTLMMGNLSMNFFDKFAYLNKIKQIDYIYYDAITESKFDDFVAKFKKYYVNAFIYDDKYVSNNETFEVEYNRPFVAGDFIITKRFYIDEVLGYDVEVDNFNYFFASEGELSYNYKEGVQQLFRNKNYDIVYLNDKTELSTYVENIAVSSQKDKNADYTYYNQGNFKLEFNKVWKYRSCD